MRQLIHMLQKTTSFFTTYFGNGKIKIIFAFVLPNLLALIAYDIQVFVNFIPKHASSKL